MNNILLLINRYPIIKHFAYWTVFVLFWGLIWGLSDYQFSRNILIQINCLPSRILLVYLSLYVLVPKYFDRKRYWEFFISYSLLVLFISIVIQRPWMLFYVQPTYMPNWNTNNFFGSSEIINTALDINIAAVIPLIYRLLGNLDRLGKGNKKLEEENISFKERKEIVSIDLKIDKSVHKVLIDDIVYIESLRNNVRIRLLNTEIIARQNISSFENMLPENVFMRVHRSFIVNKVKISSFSISKIEIHQETIPIGRLYKEAVRKILATRINI